MKPLINRSLFKLSTTIRIRWDFLAIRRKSNDDELQLPKHLALPFTSFCKLNRIINNLECVRLISRFNNQYYDIYSWQGKPCNPLAASSVSYLPSSGAKPKELNELYPKLPMTFENPTVVADVP